MYKIEQDFLWDFKKNIIKNFPNWAILLDIIVDKKDHGNTWHDCFINSIFVCLTDGIIVFFSSMSLRIFVYELLHYNCILPGAIQWKGIIQVQIRVIKIKLKQRQNTEKQEWRAWLVSTALFATIWVALLPGLAEATRYSLMMFIYLRVITTIID